MENGAVGTSEILRVLRRPLRSSAGPLALLADPLESVPAENPANAV